MWLNLTNIPCSYINTNCFSILLTKSILLSSLYIHSYKFNASKNRLCSVGVQYRFCFSLLLTHFQHYYSDEVTLTHSSISHSILYQFYLFNTSKNKCFTFFCKSTTCCLHTLYLSLLLYYTNSLYNSCSLFVDEKYFCWTASSSNIFPIVGILIFWNTGLVANYHIQFFV